MFTMTATRLIETTTAAMRGEARGNHEYVLTCLREAEEALSALKAAAEEEARKVAA